MLTSGQKIEAMRLALKALAEEQLVANTIVTWALEGAELPAFALLQLANATIDHLGEKP